MTDQQTDDERVKAEGYGVKLDVAGKHSTIVLVMAAVFIGSSGISYLQHRDMAKSLERLAFQQAITSCIISYAPADREITAAKTAHELRRLCWWIPEVPQ